MKPKVKKKEERRRKRAQVRIETLLHITLWYTDRTGGKYARVTVIFFLYRSTVHFPHLDYSKRHQWEVLVGSELYRNIHLFFLHSDCSLCIYHMSIIVILTLSFFHKSFNILSTFALSWLTNLLLLKQKLKNAETISEEVLEQRQQELEEKFPERKELDLDAPWQMDLLKLQRKVK